MKLSLQNHKTALITLIAIVGLVASLAFNVARLLDIERDVRNETTYSSVWAMTQTQIDATLLAESLMRYAYKEAFATLEERPASRLPILIDRLGGLLEGPPAGTLDRIGMLGKLKENYLHFTLAVPLIETGLDTRSVLLLRDQAQDLARLMSEATNQVMILHRDDEASKRASYMRLVFQSTLFIIGIAISTAFLLVRLFKKINEARETRQLLLQEQKLSDLVINNISNQGIVIFDESLRCLLWNPGMEGLIGIKPEDAVGRGIQTLDPLFAKPDVANSLLGAVRGTNRIFEDASFLADGHERCLEINCLSLVMAERRLGIAFFRDVTEQWLARKRAERQNLDLEIKVLQRTAALRQAERRLIAAIESAPDGFAAFDWTGKLLFANEQIWAAEPIAIWCWEEMTLPVFLRCFSMCEGADDRLLLTKPPFEEVELDLLIKKDVWARLSVTKADGATVFVRLTDISGYKQAARLLQFSLDREREITNAYRSFVSMVSHQFRTPLAILDSSAQRILRRAQDITQDELVARVQKIRNATGRLTRLVESVLNAAKLDAGRIELNPSPHDLAALVLDICERQRDLSPQAEIRFEAPHTPVQVYCDSMLIEQVVINLLSNAVKYSGEAPVVEVKVWVDGARAYCSVRDWGIGIPADEVPKIFDRFYRARTAIGIAGTGIGLNFAQQIMHLHGGEIQVESFEAAGSLFTIDLPISNVDEAQQAA